MFLQTRGSGNHNTDALPNAMGILWCSFCLCKVCTHFAAAFSGVVDIQPQASMRYYLGRSFGENLSLHAGVGQRWLRRGNIVNV